MNNFDKKLQGVLDKQADLNAKIEKCTDFGSDEYAHATKELAELEEICAEIKHFFKKKSDLLAANDLLLIDDPDIKNLAEQEVRDLKMQIESAELKLKILLLPKDVDSEKNAILEIRAGTGGDEAGLFAADLLRMYELYAGTKGWNFELLNINDNGIGSIKEASAIVSGKGAFARLRYESGVHRVQRVPETESSGRIHTSAATVAVLPEAEEIDVTIDEKDLIIDTYRASGAGGQHVNKTDSAVRITHIPTGVVVAMQDERSQHKNRAKALKVLRSKIYEEEKRKSETSRAENRRSQIGSGDRSERIRTYNFPQGRVTDHRINLTLYKIDKVITGIALDEIIDKLIEADQLDKLNNMNF